MSASGGVAVEAEDLGELVLDGRGLGEHAVGAGPAFDDPKPLFQTRVPEGVDARHAHYVPARDGQRFLINTQSGDPAPNPITVVLNWTAGLKK